MGMVPGGQKESKRAAAKSNFGAKSPVRPKKSRSVS